MVYARVLEAQGADTRVIGQVPETARFSLSCPLSCPRSRTCHTLAGAGFQARVVQPVFTPYHLNLTVCGREVSAYGFKRDLRR